MRSNRSRDTRPERALRSAVHRRGLRFRVAARPFPEVRRTADLVFSRSRVAVFLDGCFWHGCPQHYSAPVAHCAYWAEKVRRNRDRDVAVDQLLRAAGWVVLRVWEHEDPEAAAVRVSEVVRARSETRGSSRR
ncbi:MAG: very short patch repair endonuclease [Actinomycetota bacterium]|nr:very short patch repair endonuclease [Actinomycetota bacterium]